jgi:hypothetical protein
MTGGTPLAIENPWILLSLIGFAMSVVSWVVQEFLLFPAETRYLRLVNKARQEGKLLEQSVRAQKDALAATVNKWGDCVAALYQFSVLLFFVTLVGSLLHPVLG